MVSSDEERLAFVASLRLPRGSYWTLCFDTPSFDRRFATAGEGIVWLASPDQARRLLAGLDAGIRIEEDVIEAAYTCDLVGLQTSVAVGEQSQSHGDLLDTVDLLDDMLLTAFECLPLSPATKEVSDACRTVLDELARGLFESQRWSDVVQRAGGQRRVEHALHDALGIVLAASSFGSLPPVQEWEALSAAARSGDASAVRQLGRSAMAD